MLRCSYYGRAADGKTNMLRWALLCTLVMKRWRKTHDEKYCNQKHGGKRYGSPENQSKSAFESKLTESVSKPNREYSTILTNFLSGFPIKKIIFIFGKDLLF